MCKGIIAVTAGLLLLSHMGYADDRAKQRKRCAKVQQEIGRIHARMRQPYRAAQGERYRERLTALRLEWAKKCR